jgi:hypothetical protein
VSAVAVRRGTHRRGHNYLTLAQASVLCAVAASWQVCGRPPALMAGGVRRLTGVADARGAVQSLVVRGFLQVSWMRGRANRMVMDCSTLRLTQRAWSELGVEPRN